MNDTLSYFRSMQFFPRIFLIVLSIIAANATSAQGLYQNKFQGPYLLLYKLSSQQVEFLTKHPEKIDTTYLFTRLVGKIHTDSIIPLYRKPIDEFPIKPFTDHKRYQKCGPRFHVWDIRENGYYLEVSVNTLYTANYRLIENPLFNAGVHKIGYETYIFVEDTAGLPVYNAKVHLDTFSCPFDSSVGGYRITGKNISGIIKIERDGIYTMTNLNGYRDKTNNTKPPSDKFKYSKIKYQGYLVTNKPIYKPWDTLFFKSYLVNKRGKPLKSKLIARLYQNYSGYAKEFVINPIERGAYHGFFVINDSFTLDQEIAITLLTKKRHQIIVQNARLENYELKDLKFEFRADKNLVTPGDGIKFYATATTANNLPVMDGKLTLKIQLNNVNFTDGDSVSIPFKKWENWYSTSVQADPSGVTVFDIPDSIFIPLEGQYKATCSLITADNEIKEAAAVFNYQTTRDRQEAGLDGDTLRVQRLYLMKSVRRSMRIKLFSRKDQLSDSVFQTPINLYLPPNIYMAQIFRGDTLAGTFYRQTRLPEVTGKRTHDSIHIEFRSTFDIPVFYRIYANNKLVAKGKSTFLSWHSKDRKKNSYHIQYGILDGSVIMPRFYSKSFHLAEKELKVEIIQPTIIYPGQEVAIEIRVKDAYGKPVNKVNLAAWAVNTQMEGIVTPNVPYLGLVKPQKPMPTKNWPTYPIPSTYQSYLKDWQINGFMLRKNEVFRLVYPEKGFQVLRDTTPHKTTEIEFYAHGNQTRQNIIYVKANDTLFTSVLNGAFPSIKKINPGNYDFTVRTFDHTYTFKNIEILKGKKNFICLNTDSLKKLNIGDTISEGMLTESELKMHYDQTMLMRYDNLLSDTFIIKVNGKVEQGFPFGYSLNAYLRSINITSNLFNPEKGRNRYTTTQNFMLFGPLNAGDEVELIWKNGFSHLINFQPGKTISLTAKDQVSEYIPTWTDEIRFLQRNSNQSYTFNTFWWDPYYIDTTKKKQIITQYLPPRYQNQTTLQEFQYNNYSPNVYPTVLNSYLNLYISNLVTPKRIWVFNREDSIYSTLENYFSFGNNYPTIGQHARRNLTSYAPSKQKQQFRLVLEINDTMWIVKNFAIDSSTHLFLTLKTSEIRKLGQKEYIFYDRLAKNLAREALVQWTDTPSINKGLFVIPLKQIKGTTSIEGTVIGPGIKYPVSNAFVVLERNGIFVSGAITNREGRFSMTNLQPGNYMLKIKGTNYHYWLHYSLEIKAGFNHLVQAQMKPYASMSYNRMVYSDAITESMQGSYTSNSSNAYSNDEPQYLERNISMSAVAISKKYKSNAPKLIEFRGSRSESEDQYIDGIRKIPGVSDGKFRLKDKAESLGKKDEEWDDSDRERENDRLTEMASDSKTKRTRKDFKDYAYWIPNFYTNKQGHAGFSVKYPDNVTSWKTFVPAMDGKRHSGLGEITVKSYKPVVTSLALPLFLTEGDVLTAYGRVMNYTGKTLQGNYKLKYNFDVLDKEISIKDIYNDSIKVTGTKPGDTLNIEASFELSNGYRDAEMRKIIVNAASVVTGISMFEEINSDTTIVFIADSNDIGMDIAVYNHKLALILEMINQVENLPTYDNRSIAAYLNALLIKKSVCKTLNIPFLQEKQIREAMTKLKRSQCDNGLFGWFKGSKHSFVVSTYVAEAMYHAQQMGYENNTWLNLAKSMEKQLTVVYGHERLSYLLCLKNLNRTADYDKWIATLKPINMDRSEKLDYYRLLQLTGKKVPLSEINGMMENTNEGNLKISGTWNWQYAPVTDDAANTFKAWTILFEANTFPQRRKALAEYLATECPSYSSSWIKAAEAMVAETTRDSSLSKELKPEVYINDIWIPAHKLPAMYHLKPGQHLTMKHKGAPVYIAANRKFKTYNPVTDSSQFNIEVSVPKIKTNHLQAGTPIEMKVTVFAKRNQYNAVIDIPIPAGCVYGSKIQGENWVESHREYQTDRVLIFSDELPFGYHTFTILLVPKFNGSFYTAPARSALMFYPDKAAFTKKQQWIISK